MSETYYTKPVAVRVTPQSEHPNVIDQKQLPGLFPTCFVTAGRYLKKGGGMSASYLPVYDSDLIVDYPDGALAVVSPEELTEKFEEGSSNG